MNEDYEKGTGEVNRERGKMVIIVRNVLELFSDIIYKERIKGKKEKPW
ncbi:MAG: hypothetical protein K2L89_09045 [Muribaculaceae bacterium]|nr:hypothetical protein [Muribaculaceae bacterium]